MPFALTHSPLGSELAAEALADGTTEVRRGEVLFKAGAFQSANFIGANFSSIGTGEKGVIPIFNVGVERKPGHAMADLLDTVTPVTFSDPAERVVRNSALILELASTIAPGFEALVFKASRGIEDN